MLAHFPWQDCLAGGGGITSPSSRQIGHLESQHPCPGKPLRGLFLREAQKRSTPFGPPTTLPSPRLAIWRASTPVLYLESQHPCLVVRKAASWSLSEGSSKKIDPFWAPNNATEPPLVGEARPEIQSARGEDPYGFRQGREKATPSASCALECQCRRTMLPVAVGS